jgi:hypothetical protein
MNKYQFHGKSYEGFETLVTPVKKSFRSQVRIFIALVILQIIFFCIAIWYMYDDYTTRAAFMWLLCKGVSIFFPYTPMYFIQPDGTKIIISAQKIFLDPELSSFARYYLKEMLNVFGCCSIIYLSYPLFLIWARNRSRKLLFKMYISGTNLISSQQLKKNVRKKKDKMGLPCGTIHIPVSSEEKHCLVMGINDSDRKAFYSQLIQYLKKKKHKIIVYDPSGTYISRFFDPETDIIFNPIDTRTIGWSLLNEIESNLDYDAITSCLLSDISNPEMKANVKSVYSGIFAASMHKKKTKNKDIYNLLSGDFPSISNALQNVEKAQKGYRHISDPNTRHATSILSVVSQYSKCFEYMTLNDGPFRMKQWFMNQGGTIFISSDLNSHDKLVPVLSLFLDLLFQRLLSSEGLTYPVYYLLDNFISLKRTNYLQRMLLASGSKGGRVFLGCQDFDQIDNVYHRDNRQLIVNNCGNYVFFRITNPASAKTCSDIIGETEFVETGRTLTGASQQLQKKREPLIFPTDIMNMHSRQAIVRFSGYDPLKTFFQNTKTKYSARIPDLIRKNV